MFGSEKTKGYKEVTPRFNVSPERAYDDKKKGNASHWIHRYYES